jgi:hypothetical protein
MKRFLTALFVAGLVWMLAGGASAAGWVETWESYTSGVTPYDQWVLNTGTWSALGTPAHGGSKAYKIAPVQVSRIGKNLGFVATQMASVTLQGWFYDSSTSTSKRSWLGFQNGSFAVDTALVRIGMNNAAAYQVHYYYNSAVQIINLPFGNQVGWHYVKLALTPQGGGNWRVDWQINKVDNTAYTGNFTYPWNAATAGKVVVGYNYSTTYEVDWDDITLTGVPVPEPGSLLVLGSGLMGLAAFMAKRRRS